MFDITSIFTQIQGPAMDAAVVAAVLLVAYLGVITIRSVWDALTGSISEDEEYEYTQEDFDHQWAELQAINFREEDKENGNEDWWDNESND